MKLTNCQILTLCRLDYSSSVYDEPRKITGLIIVATFGIWFAAELLKPLTLEFGMPGELKQNWVASSASDVSSRTSVAAAAAADDKSLPFPRHEEVFRRAAATLFCWPFWPFFGVHYNISFPTLRQFEQLFCNFASSLLLYMRRRLADLQSVIHLLAKKMLIYRVVEPRIIFDYTCIF